MRLIADQDYVGANPIAASNKKPRNVLRRYGAGYSDVGTVSSSTTISADTL